MPWEPNAGVSEHWAVYQLTPEQAERAERIAADLVRDGVARDLEHARRAIGPLAMLYRIDEFDLAAHVAAYDTTLEGAGLALRYHLRAAFAPLIAALERILRRLGLE
jgi:hypothetical protein